MKKVLASMIILLLLVGMAPMAAATVYNPFTDVGAGEYYYEAVLWAVDEGVTLGTAPGVFGPAGLCTRAQAVTFLWRAAGSPLPVESRNPFADVKPDAYYHTAVLWAVEQGLTTGTAPGVFSPELECTRAQIATLLYRLADAPEGAERSPFTDVGAGDYFYAPVLWAVNEGITLGVGEGLFAPDQPCTRGQIVTFMHRGKALFEPPVEEEEELVIPEGSLWLCNPYDGYNLLYGPEFTADTSRAEFVSILRSEDTTVEIYRQVLGGIAAETYINESHSFLSNATDHTLVLQEQKVYGGRNVYTTAWSREALYEGDRCHYISFDIPKEDAVYTVLVKSARETAPEEYKVLLRSMEFFTPTAEAPLITATPKIKQWNAETQAFYEQYFALGAPQKWGLMEYNAAEKGDLSTVKGYEQEIGYAFPILSTYSGFTEKSLNLLSTRLENAWAEGKVLQLSLQPDPLKEGNVLYAILRGEYDAQIDFYAQTVKEFAHPVLLRLMNEMNGVWCTYSAIHTGMDTQIYIQAYRYIVDRFAEAGVENVLWVWNPNEISYPTYDWNHMMMYYPGDEYVDIVGLTAFNTGTYFEALGERWRDFDTLYQGLYEEYTARFAHPLMITGFACAEMGGDKREWTEDMFQKIGKFDRIKVVIWWDHVDYDPDFPGEQIVSRDYRITPVLDLFQKYIGTPDPDPDPELPDPDDPVDPGDPTEPEDDIPTDSEKENNE